MWISVEGRCATLCLWPAQSVPLAIKYDEIAKTNNITACDVRGSDNSDRRRFEIFWNVTPCRSVNILTAFEEDLAAFIFRVQVFQECLWLLREMSSIFNIIRLSWHLLRLCKPRFLNGSVDQCTCVNLAPCPNIFTIGLHLSQWAGLICGRMIAVIKNKW
jgi:hypothetical protein